MAKSRAVERSYDVERVVQLSLDAGRSTLEVRRLFGAAMPTPATVLTTLSAATAEAVAVCERPLERNAESPGWAGSLLETWFAAAQIAEAAEAAWQRLGDRSLSPFWVTKGSDARSLMQEVEELLRQEEPKLLGAYDKLARSDVPSSAAMSIAAQSLQGKSLISVPQSRLPLLAAIAKWFGAEANRGSSSALMTPKEIDNLHAVLGQAPLWSTKTLLNVSIRAGKWGQLSEADLLGPRHRELRGLAGVLVKVADAELSKRLPTGVATAHRKSRATTPGARWHDALGPVDVAPPALPPTPAPAPTRGVQRTRAIK